MSSEGTRSPHDQTHRPKRRVVTSCSECYRRKQKCNRVKPCNFCSARGIPERCQYDEAVKAQSTRTSSTRKQGFVRTSPRSDESSHASTMSSSSPDFIDQLGYSTISRRDQFQHIGEHVPNGDTSNARIQQMIFPSNTDVYLNLVAQLPCKKTTDELVSVYFAPQNWSFPILDDNHFLELYRQFRDQLNRDVPHKIVHRLSSVLLTFPALLFSVLATALQLTDIETGLAKSLSINTIEDSDRLSSAYLDTGQEIIELFKQQRPSVTSIEYHLIKTSWLKNAGRGSESWQCLGTALRQAQEIDLHQIQDYDTDTPDISLEQKLLRLWDLEHQKRLWARIFILDSHMAVALGRPRGINLADCSTPPPLDCEYPSNPSQTVPVGTDHTHKPPNSFSPIIFWIAQGHKYHEMMTMRALKRDLKDYSCVQTLHDETEDLLSQLPPALRSAHPDTTWDLQMPILPTIRLSLLNTANIFLMALHRPYVSTHVASRDAATRAALTILQAQQDLFQIVPRVQHRLYGPSFYTIDASIFLAAVVVKYPIAFEVSGRIQQALQQASSRLLRMKGRSKIASAGEPVLRRCCAIIEGKRSSLSGSLSDNSLDDYDQLVGPDVNFLQEYGSHVSDQPTQDLISFLAGSSTSMHTSSSDGVPVDGSAYHETQFQPFDLASVSNMNYSDPAAFHQSYWQL